MEFFRHDAGKAEADAVHQAIMKGNLTTGLELNRFRDALVTTFGFGRVELCSSGTSALYLTLHALGVGRGDEVITTPFVGVWAANMILALGATPVFADIDIRTYNLAPESVLKKVTRKTKVVLPVSVNGVPCDYAGIRKAVSSNVRIVCDDIEALGSIRGGKFVGSDVGTDVSVNGFWTSKAVTTCGGGMITSEDTDLLDRFEKLTRHGHGMQGDLWDQGFGFNAWLSDPMAAMGTVQVNRFYEKQAKLSYVVCQLDKGLHRYRKQRCNVGDVAAVFVYLIELPRYVNKRRYAVAMADRGIPTRPYFNDLQKVGHLKKYRSNCPIASGLSTRTIALPMHHEMTHHDITKVIKTHMEVLNG